MVHAGFFIGIAAADCDTGECDLAGLAGLAVALWTLLACVLGIVFIECLGARKRVLAERASP